MAIDLTTRSALSATVDPVKLAAGLQVVLRAVSPRTTLPVLNNVLLETTAEGLSLTATNLEIGIRKLIPAEVTAPGATTVPARLLTEFVAELGATASLSLALDGTTLALQCGRFDTHIRCIDASEYPLGPKPDGGDRLSLPLDSLLRAIEHTQSAASTDEARPVLTGVLFELEPPNLALVATDGHRLAMSRLSLDASGQTGIDEDLARDGARLIVPARALAEMPRAFRGEGDHVDVLVSLQRNQAFFRCGGAEVTTRLLDGTYPNYAQVLPPSPRTTARIATPELLQAVRALSQFARDGGHTIRLDIGPGWLRLAAATNEIGDGQAELTADVEGPEVQVALNARYLLDALAVVGPVTRLRSDGPLSPVLLEDPADDRLTIVVMPVRVSR